MTCPVCHRTEVMPGCPNSTCPARERTSSAADFGPSELRLIEIGALQVRVWELEAELTGLRKEHAELEKDAGRLTTAVAMSATSMGYYRELCARALSEMAAADAEMLVMQKRT